MRIVLLFMLTLCGSASRTIAQQALDENCTVTVSGLSAPVLPRFSGSGAGGGSGCGSGSSGGRISWSVANVPAGPRPVRAETVCNRPGVTLYGASDFFDIAVGGSVCANNMRLGTSRPASVLGIRSGGVSAINLSGDNTGQISVIGSMTSGGGLGGAVATAADAFAEDIAGTIANTIEFEEDLTLRSTGTGYASSNPSIASVDINGLVTGHAPGTVYITITNRGAAAVRRVTVSRGVTNTTIEGFVQLPDGTGVNGAIVRATLGLETATSSNGSSPGFFSMTLTDIPLDVSITIYVLADVDGQAYVEQLDLTPVPNGVTDAGIIVLDDIFDPFTDAIAREFAVYNNTFMDMINDVIAHEFSVYNDAFQDLISDMISREFSVYNAP